MDPHPKYCMKFIYCLPCSSCFRQYDIISRAQHCLHLSCVSIFPIDVGECLKFTLVNRFADVGVCSFVSIANYPVCGTDMLCQIQYDSKVIIKKLVDYQICM
jgi:hypothetical protein